MSLFSIRRKVAAGLVLTAFIAGPACAEKPDWAGEGKPKHGQSGRGDRGGPQDKVDKRIEKGGVNGGREQRADDVRDRSTERDRDRNPTQPRERAQRTERATPSPRGSGHFTERHREIVQQYYGDRFRAGHCPPGLARKRNGCAPPGQAKKWRIGQVLPRDVVWYDAPGEIVLRIGMPPEGQRFVRVAADILLIAAGTGMVIDAIEDLNRF